MLLAEIDIAIRFEFDPSRAWFTSHWTGRLEDHEIFDQYSKLYSSDEWVATMSELVDLSDADLRAVTGEGLASLAEMIEGVFKEADVATSKTAVYSPSNLPYGLARVYEAYTYQSPESVQVFRDRDQALRWLID